MINLGVNDSEKYFIHEDNVGIIAHGESVEDCFENTAKILFSLVSEIENLHSIQVISLEFEESDVEVALLTFLNLLLEKSREQNILFGDFRLRRDGDIWKVTVAGEPKRDELLQGITIKQVLPQLLSVKKFNHHWEARCVVEM